MQDPMKLLVVDDEKFTRGAIKGLLVEEGFTVFAAGSAEEALGILKKEPINLVLTDINMPGLSGLRLLEVIKKLELETEVVIMTAQASLDTAIQAIRLGAIGYLVKPFEDLNNVIALVNGAVERQRLAAENRQLLDDLKDKNEKLAQATKRAEMLLKEAQSLPLKIVKMFSAKGLDETEQKVVEALSYLMEGRPVVMFGYSDKLKELVAKKAAGLKPDTVAALRAKLPPPIQGVRWIEREEYVSPIKDLFRRHLHSEMLDAPLVSNGNNNRILVVGEGSQGPFLARERALLDHFVPAAVLAIEGLSPTPQNITQKKSRK